MLESKLVKSSVFSLQIMSVASEWSYRKRTHTFSVKLFTHFLQLKKPGGSKTEPPFPLLKDKNGEEHILLVSFCLSFEMGINFISRRISHPIITSIQTYTK